MTKDNAAYNDNGVIERKYELYSNTNKMHPLSFASSKFKYSSPKKVQNLLMTIINIDEQQALNNIER